MKLQLPPTRKDLSAAMSAHGTRPRRGRTRQNYYPNRRFYRPWLGSAAESMVLAQSFLAAFQDKPLRSIRPGAEDRGRAWEPANSVLGSHIQAARTPRVHGSARSRSGARSWIPRRVRRQNAHHRHTAQPVYGNIHRHSPGCRSRAAQLLKESMPQVPRGKCRQTRRPEANEREKAIQWKFFRSGRRKGRPQRPILAPLSAGVKKNLRCFPHCTSACATRRALPISITGLC